MKVLGFLTMLSELDKVFELRYSSCMYSAWFINSFNNQYPIFTMTLTIDLQSVHIKINSLRPLFLGDIVT